MIDKGPALTTLDPLRGRAGVGTHLSAPRPRRGRAAGPLPAGPVAISARRPPAPLCPHQGKVLPAWIGAGRMAMVPQEPAVPASIVGPGGGLATVGGRARAVSGGSWPVKITGPKALILRRGRPVMAEACTTWILVL